MSTAPANLDRQQLRLLIREILQDAMGRPAAVAAVTPGPAAAPSGPTPLGPLAAEQRSRVDTVRIGSDGDLDQFVRQLLRLFENPKTRDELRQGRLRFRLAGTATGPGASTRVERGAVTERHLAELAGTGGTLVLGPRAVLTPLARERARALGLTVVKERS